MATRPTRPSLKARLRVADDEADIREALDEGDPVKARNLALASVQSEASKRYADPVVGALIDAELTGTFLAIARDLHQYKPSRPGGVQAGLQVRHLIAAFESALNPPEEGDQR
jgi:hypothetical protein